MSSHKPIDSETQIKSDQKIESLEQQARDLARSVEKIRQQTLTQSNERIEALEQKARDLARFVETTRQQTLLQSDKKTEALEQKARDLADFVETLRNQTRVQSETEIEALVQQARDLALSVETIRKETRLQSETEIAVLGQQARDLAVSVESVREKTLVQSDNEIAALGRQATDLACSVERVRQQTLAQSNQRIEALEKRARAYDSKIIGSAEQARDMIGNILEASSEYSIIGKGLDGTIVLWNEGATQLYGYQPEEVIGLANASLLHTPEDVAAGKHLEIMDLAVHNGKWEGLITRLRKNGERFTARAVVTPRRDTHGRAIGFLLISKDISAEIRLTEELSTNKELEAFSYSVSHDLRAPLRAIDGFSRILLDEYSNALPDQAKAFLKLVCDNTRQMAQLVDDLLVFSRLGRQALTKQTVDPGKIVRQCLAEMQTEQKGRQMQIDIGDLPSCQADTTLLKQVWTNLLSNALKYTRKRDAVRIAIGSRMEPRPLTNGQVPHTADRSEETVYFVTDNGAGFDMKYAEKLFGVFQRLHRAADFEGTGVGLAIVQRIINRHGGRVWGEAQLNQGATFSFTLE